MRAACAVATHELEPTTPAPAQVRTDEDADRSIVDQGVVVGTICPRPLRGPAGLEREPGRGWNGARGVTGSGRRPGPGAQELLVFASESSVAVTVWVEPPRV